MAGHGNARQGKPGDPRQWSCPKCGGNEAEMGESRQSGSGLASMFDIEGRSFTTLGCRNCGYTEFYAVKPSRLQALFDFGIG